MRKLCTWHHILRQSTPHSSTKRIPAPECTAVLFLERRAQPSKPSYSRRLGGDTRVRAEPRVVKRGACTRACAYFWERESVWACLCSCSCLSSNQERRSHCQRSRLFLSSHLNRKHHCSSTTHRSYLCRKPCPKHSEQGKTVNRPNGSLECSVNPIFPPVSPAFG